MKMSLKRRGDLGDDQVAVLVESGNSGTRPAAHSERAICWRSAKDMYGDRMNSLAKVVCAAIKVLVAMTLALNIVVKNCVATGVSVQEAGARSPSSSDGGVDGRAGAVAR